MLLGRFYLGAACAGSQEGQIPHVVCTNAEVKDKNGALFIREFYANLLRGESIQLAFNQGRDAVESNGHPSES